MKKTMKLLALLVFTGAILQACDTCAPTDPTKKEEVKRSEDSKK